MNKDALVNFLQEVKNLAEENDEETVEINENLTVRNHFCCPICRGYFYDATTIAECLHTFCKSCIVKHFNQKKDCPVCGTQAHETTPLLSLRPDRLLQEILHAIVPVVCEKELKFQKNFWDEKGLPIPENPWQTYVHSEEAEEEMLKCLKSGTDDKMEDKKEDKNSKISTGEKSKKGDKKDKKQPEPICYINPMRFLHLKDAHLHCNDETVKVTVVGKIPKDNSFVYKLDCLRISERACITELRNTLMLLYNSTAKPVIPADLKNIKIIQATMDKLALPPHGDERTDKFPFQLCENLNSDFDEVTTIGMLQNYQYSLNRSTDMIIEYGVVQSYG